MTHASSLRLYEVPVSTIMAFVEAIAACPHCDSIAAAEFAGYGSSTAKKALTGAQTLGLINENSGKYTCAADSVARGMPQHVALGIFRRALQGFRPFEVVCEGLALGESPQEAVLRARLLLGLRTGEESKLRILLRWGTETGLIVDGEEDGLSIRKDLVAATEEEWGLVSPDDLDSQMKARLFNSRKLGQSANHFLDEVDRQLLADALILIPARHKASVEATGQALEDFLRQVAGTASLQKEAKKCSGSGQLANLLLSNRIIHSHHQKLVDAVGAIRNAKAHKKDKVSLTPWKITKEGALAAAMMNLVAIRSIYEFVFLRRQIL